MTQSYFLAATDAAGRPLEWHALPRLEAIEAELPPHIEAAIKERCRGERCATALRHRPLFPRRCASPFRHYWRPATHSLLQRDSYKHLCEKTALRLC